MELVKDTSYWSPTQWLNGGKPPGKALQRLAEGAAAANKLNCSEGYIFKVLKDNGLKLKDVINKHNASTSGE